MKNLYFLIALISFCNTSFICNAGTQPIVYKQIGFRSDVYHQGQFAPSDSSQPSDYTYDSLGRLTKQYVRQWNGTTWTPSYYAEWNYRQRDLLSFHRYNWDTQSKSYHNANQTIYVYNNLNWLSSDTLYTWNDSAQLWLYSSYYTYAYNDSALDILKNIYNWNNTTQSWSLSYVRGYVYDHGIQYLTEQYQPPLSGEKWLYGFDASGRVITDTAARYDFNRHIWFYSALNISQYDSKGNLTYKLFYGFDTVSNSFYITQFDSSVFDNNNYLVEDYLGTKTLNTEYIFIKNIYTNDNKGNNLLKIEYTWDSISQLWRNNNKIVSSYDSRGNQELYITYSWNNTTQSWQGNNKDSMQYDSRNHQTLMVIQYWDSTYWANNSYNQMEIEYSDSGNVLMQTQNLYNWRDSIWLLDHRGIYQFDEHGNEIFRLAESGSPTAAIITSGVRYYYYYEALEVLTDNSIMPNPLTIYPDPASQTLTIALSQTYLNDPYSVYNLIGQRMAFGFLSGNNYSIDVSGYTEGTYILKVNNLTRKFVVKR